MTRKTQKDRWDFLVNRKEIRTDEWLQLYTSGLTKTQKARVVKLLESIMESTKSSWTKFQPDDWIGPYLFHSSCFDIEDAWGLFSDSVRITEPDIYKKIEAVWLEDERAFKLGDLLDLMLSQNEPNAAH